MKKILLSLLATSGCMMAGYAEELQQTLYFDFGSVTESQGTTTVGADANGNHWNNITNNTSGNKYAAAGTVYDNIVNSADQATGFTLTLNSRFSTNGKSGGGGLLAPDAALLGDLAVASATEDYFFIESSENNSNFTISGLDPQKSYRFHIFASRRADDNRIGTYIIEGLNKVSGDLQAAGKGIGHDGENQNTSNILVCDPVFPDTDGDITFTVSRNTGAYIPLNAMKIEELTGGERPEAPTLVLSAMLTGSATENGVSTPMLLISPDGKNNGIYACFTKLQPGTFTITAVTDKDETVVYGITADGQLTAGSENAYNVEAEQLSMIRVDFANSTVTVTPITACSLTGSAVHGWSTTNVEDIPYIGNGVWRGEVELTARPSVTDRSRFNFILNNGWGLKFSRVAGTANSVGLASDGFTLSDINLNFGRYIITLDLNEFIYNIEAADGIDDNRITVMGSSVSNGQGATDNHGYAYMFDNLLTTRHDDALSEYPFFISSIAVNGNNTVNLLNRYDELVNDFGRYVIFGVSLGNEGIHGAADQEAVYNQFATNMQTLITKAREDGKIPVVMNNYTRGDFDESDYAYVKRMNMLINSWDVPSVNLLGAIDNGEGRWADDHQNGDDIYHPDTKGHAELFHAIVPSLFDAIRAGKPIPARVSGHTVSISDKGKVEFTPQDEVHPFALYVDLAEIPAGKFVTITTPDGDATLSVDNNTLTYTSPDGATLTGTIDVPCAVTLSHYYAQGVTYLYAGDNHLGTLSEKIAPTKFTITPQPDKNLKLGEMMFYRSALNADEVKALNQGKMLQSSLEVYLPFSDADHLDDNMAQATTPVTVLTGYSSGLSTLSADDPGAPFEAIGGHGDITVNVTTPMTVTIHTLDGRRAAVATVTDTVRFPLPAGIYLVNTAKVAVR